MPEGTREIHAAIERDRAVLAGTLEALAHKVNVKARTRELVSIRAKGAKTAISGGAPGSQAEGGSVVRTAATNAYVGGAFVVGVLGSWWVTRRRSRYRAWRLQQRMAQPPWRRTLATVGRAGFPLACAAGAVYWLGVRPRLARSRQLGNVDGTAEPPSAASGEAVVVGLTGADAMASASSDVATRPPGARS
jgi:hypothetical protein